MSYFNSKYPSVALLKKKARLRVPKFAFEYLEGGCDDDINLNKNKADIKAVELMPKYIGSFEKVSLKTVILGKEYDAPFGVSPIDLQGLIWPGSAEYLAEAAHHYNIPFILSTVTTASIESIERITNGDFWFQLYHPAKWSVTKDILNRAEASGCQTLVVLSDVPSFGYRPRDIKNGLSMPPKYNIRNFLQVINRPTWALNTLKSGIPEFQTIKKYMPKNLDLNQLGQFMNDTFNGRLNIEKLKRLRDHWKGNLILKGVVNPIDLEETIKVGFDGIIVSNHGGRQLDAGQSSIVPLKNLASSYEGKSTIMMDSGIRSGSDIARSIACGADFTFLGRPFMYGVAALGKNGAFHTIEMLKKQLTQIMEQLCCEETAQLRKTLIQ